MLEQIDFIDIHFVYADEYNINCILLIDIILINKAPFSIHNIDIILFYYIEKNTVIVTAIVVIMI